MIKFRCQTCYQKVGVRDQVSGMRVKCPTCGKPARVPNVEPGMTPEQVRGKAVYDFTLDHVQAEAKRLRAARKAVAASARKAAASGSAATPQAHVVHEKKVAHAASGRPQSPDDLQRIPDESSNAEDNAGLQEEAVEDPAGEYALAVDDMAPRSGRIGSVSANESANGNGNGHDDGEDNGHDDVEDDASEYELALDDPVPARSRRAAVAAAPPTMPTAPVQALRPTTKVAVVEADSQKNAGRHTRWLWGGLLATALLLLVGVGVAIFAVAPTTKQAGAAQNASLSPSGPYISKTGLFQSNTMSFRVPDGWYINDINMPFDPDAQVRLDPWGIQGYVEFRVIASSGTLEEQLDAVVADVTQFATDWEQGLPFDSWGRLKGSGRVVRMENPGQIVQLRIFVHDAGNGRFYQITDTDDAFLMTDAKKGADTLKSTFRVVDGPAGNSVGSTAPPAAAAATP